MTGTFVKFKGQTCGINLPNVQAFYHQNGSAHLLLACHAALPLSLTPELLYSLWVNFQIDCAGTSLTIPWVATADLLLSNLCEEVGTGLYEMDQQVRTALLHYLETDQHFGLKRIREIAVFLGTYVQPQLKSENPDIQDFAKAQNWVSMAYLEPEKAARELATALANTFQQQLEDLLRIASIVGALEKPLADYPDHLIYARGMLKYAQGDIESAQKEFEKIQKSESLCKLSDNGLPLPGFTQQQVEVEQKRTFFPLTTQFLASLAIGALLTSGTFLVFRPEIQVITLESETSSESDVESFEESLDSFPETDDQPFQEVPNSDDVEPGEVPTEPISASSSDLPNDSEELDFQEVPNSSDEIEPGELPIESTNSSSSASSSANEELDTEELEFSPSTIPTEITESSTIENPTASGRSLSETDQPSEASAQEIGAFSADSAINQEPQQPEDEASSSLSDSNNDAPAQISPANNEDEESLANRVLGQSEVLMVVSFQGDILIRQTPESPPVSASHELLIREGANIIVPPGSDNFITLRSVLMRDGLYGGFNITATGVPGRETIFLFPCSLQGNRFMGVELYSGICTGADSGQLRLSVP